MEVTINFHITFGALTVPPGATKEDMAECIMHGLLSLRDNSVEIASVEDFETGEQHGITINDFIMGDTE